MRLGIYGLLVVGNGKEGARAAFFGTSERDLRLERENGIYEGVVAISQICCRIGLGERGRER